MCDKTPGCPPGVLSSLKKVVQKRLWAFLNHKLYCRFSD
ncbi:hypothetical protein FAEPRAM212_00480 [Faecalibacterium prausnitzii M21/2]|uniref:Uncharacterized protein n=1 Tax=Faecalibacterium prausnitzii M21/2 TaxID=411485 RepID=A8S7I1_9FIRM|nr:hypothetical protein FAEPRAM212_00480 [Faecalibacterium prausnitzii M21/2]